MAQAVADGWGQHFRRGSRFGRVEFLMEYKLDERDSDVDGANQKNCFFHTLKIFLLHRRLPPIACSNKQTGSQG